jgi:hypothetical protein
MLGILKICYYFVKGEYYTIRLNIESLSKLLGLLLTKLDTYKMLVLLKEDYLNSAYLY